MSGPTKDDLKIRVIELECLILEFAANHEMASDEWKNQDHVKPIFDEAMKIAKTIEEIK